MLRFGKSDLGAYFPLLCKLGIVFVFLFKLIPPLGIKDPRNFKVKVNGGVIDNAFVITCCYRMVYGSLLSPAAYLNMPLHNEITNQGLCQSH